MTLPIVWSIAGTDSGGGAGLAADQRAAEALGTHLCPVVAAVTAQNSVAVTQVQPVPPGWLDAQLAALAADMPPRAIKCGLLGSVDNLQVLLRWVDRLRAEHGDIPLVVDPVFGASTGRGFVDEALLAAYRDELLPRTTLLTPNRREAALLLGEQAGSVGEAAAVPALARALRARGAQAAVITGGDSAAVDGRVLDWLDTPQAAGWLAALRIDTIHHHGTGCTFASSAAAAMALGHVAADAVVLAKMATLHALRRGSAAGQGAGPVRAGIGFGDDPSLMPMLSWGEATGFAPPREATDESLGLYAIVDSAARVQQVLAAGVRTVQLRIKAGEAEAASLRDEVQTALQACRAVGAQLFINDHWELAIALGAPGVHLGQEDLMALGDSGRAALAASGVALGISSHSLWELARARALAPRYIACGPVWPTLTKRMPWRSQGLDNLRWWCRMADHPVVAIGGILAPDQAETAAACGADGVCVVRGLGERPAAAVPGFLQALQAGRQAARQPGRLPAPSLPHPMLG
jgi:hydroxymethylpyrimidine kinase/phosphomethylpyrimidine kinase/thiamine-phosphate diphosphorylase